MTMRETSAQIDEDAAAWVVRIDAGPLSPQDEFALKAWAAADPRRAGALARASAIFARFDAQRCITDD
jgi:transmembrane sensor